MLCSWFCPFTGGKNTPLRSFNHQDHNGRWSFRGSEAGLVDSHLRCSHCSRLKICLLGGGVYWHTMQYIDRAVCIEFNWIDNPIVLPCCRWGPIQLLNLRYSYWSGSSLVVTMLSLSDRLNITMLFVSLLKSEAASIWSLLSPCSSGGKPTGVLCGEPSAPLRRGGNNGTNNSADAPTTTVRSCSRSWVVDRY